MKDSLLVHTFNFLQRQLPITYADFLGAIIMTGGAPHRPGSSGPCPVSRRRTIQDLILHPAEVPCLSRQVSTRRIVRFFAMFAGRNVKSRPIGFVATCLGQLPHQDAIHQERGLESNLTADCTAVLPKILSMFCLPLAEDFLWIVAEMSLNHFKGLAILVFTVAYAELEARYLPQSFLDELSDKTLVS